ncbi:unnamed protein product [Fusarium langsethiae]|nr:unnamed protein product [Fusarium langsethiae]
MTNSTQTSLQTSYAEIARTPPTSQPSNVHPLSSTNSTPSVYSDTLFSTIDISRVSKEEAGKITEGTVRSAVEREMRASSDTSWRCLAVTVNARNPSRIMVACRDEVEHQRIKQAVEKAKLAAGVRVLRDELYPVKVDNVKRTAVLEETGEIRLGAAEAFGQENETIPRSAG